MKIHRAHFGDIITRHPGKTFLLVMLVTLLMFFISMSPGIFGLEQNVKEEEDAWLPDNELASTFDDLQNNYGSNVNYLQLFAQGKNNNVLTKDALLDILEVEKQIADSQKVQYVLFPSSENIVSISSAIATNMLLQQNVSPEDITYDMMIETFQNIDQDTLDVIFKQFAEQLSFFLSKDFTDNIEKGQVKARATLMLIMFDSKRYDEIDDDNPILDADLEIVEIIDESDFEGIEYMGINEGEYVTHIINTEGGMEMLFMVVIIVIIIILLLTYRSLFDTIVSLLAIFFAIMWMNAIGILLGLTFASMYSAVPIILIGLGIDYAIHINMRYKEGRIKESKAIRGAMLLALVTVGASLLLSALTTGISFSTNVVSEMKPMREFGIFLMLGIFSAFLIVVTFIPSVKVLTDTYKLKRKSKQQKPDDLPSNSEANRKETKSPTAPKTRSKKDSALERGLVKVALTSTHRPYHIMTVAIIVSAVCGIMALQLTAEFDFKEFLPVDHQITDDISFIFDNFEFGVDEAAVLLKGDVTNPDALRALDETQINILDDTHINKDAPISSILTLMQDVAGGESAMGANKAFSIMYSESDTDGDGIPDQNIEDLYAFLIDNETYRQAAANVVYFNEDTGTFEGLLVRVGVNSRGGDFNEEIYEEMQDNIKPLEDVENIDAYATGGPILGHVIINSIQTSGLQSLAISVIIAAIILSILFGYEYRSIALGLFTEIPVILVIMWIYGFMYLGNIPLTVMTIMISTITIGIGIDYAIHITNRFMESIHDHGDVDEAAKSTIVNTGSALFGAAVTTIFGFGVLYFAPTNPMRMFGTFTALSISFSLLASIVVLPAFLGVYARHKLSKNPDYFKQHVDIAKVREHVSKKIHDYEHTLKDFERHLLESEHNFAHKIHDKED